MSETDSGIQSAKPQVLKSQTTGEIDKKSTKKLKLFYFVAYLLLLYVIAGMIFIILDKTSFILDHYYLNSYSLKDLSGIQEDILSALFMPFYFLLMPIWLPLRLGNGDYFSGHAAWYQADNDALIILFLIFSAFYLFTRKKATQYPDIKKHFLRKFIAGVAMLCITLIFVIGAILLIISSNIVGFIIFSSPMIIILILVFTFYLLDFLEIT